MRYYGGKFRLAKHILPVILADRKPGQTFVEPFCGGCNITDRVANPRVAGDANRYVIAMWKAIWDGWVPPYLSREEYMSIKSDWSAYPDHLVGWAGVACSFCGKWMAGYASTSKQDYIAEQVRNVERQRPLLQGVRFEACSYDELTFPDGSIVYCDPPYANTIQGYEKTRFDSDKFWGWVRSVSVSNRVLVSESPAPDDFECVFERVMNNYMARNGKVTVERLYTLML